MKTIGLPKRSVWQKQFPTLIGIGILIAALVAGVFFIGEGPGVFAPRATPETTPQKVQLTNVTDTGFSVSFYTSDLTPGFVRYGTEAGTLSSQASDDRDQLSGTVGTFRLHHVTVRGLSPNTTYYYVIGTGSRATFDNNGAPFSVKTAQRGGAPSAAQTAYGTVRTAAGSPADGAIVYLTIPGAGPMSSLVKASGSWAIPLSNARTTDGAGFASLKDSDSVNLVVQGTAANDTAQLSVTVAQSQPVADISLGTGSGAAGTTSGSGAAATATGTTGSSAPATATTTPTTSSAAGLTGSLTTISPATGPTAASNTGATSGALSELLGSASPTSSGAATPGYSEAVVDVDATTSPVVTEPPKIIGTAAPAVTVVIEVHSETQITQQVTTQSDGSFVLDLGELAEAQNLEDGEHTITISYTDPTTGQKITKTQTFTLESGQTTLLAQATGATGTSGTSSSKTSTSSSYPYSSSNPYSVTSTSSATKSSTSTRSGQVATTSALPQSGSVGTTFALVIGGLFFILAGGWSFWIAQELEPAQAADPTHDQV